MDLLTRLRDRAADLIDPKGQTMSRWDEIRGQVQDRPGSDLPRLNFEGLMEDQHEIFMEAVNEIERLNKVITEMQSESAV